MIAVEGVAPAPMRNVVPFITAIEEPSARGMPFTVVDERIPVMAALGFGMGIVVVGNPIPEGPMLIT